MGNGSSLTILKPAVPNKMNVDSYESPLTVVIGSGAPVCLTECSDNRQSFVMQVSTTSSSNLPCLYVQQQAYEPPRLALQLLSKSSASSTPSHSVIVSQPARLVNNSQEEVPLTTPKNTGKATHSCFDEDCLLCECLIIQNIIKVIVYQYSIFLK